MQTVFQKPRFWIIFTAISSILFIFAWHFFPLAMPLLQLNITMDRHQAITAAKNLAMQHDWLPKDAQTTALFATDNTAKTFIELEGGGQKAFVEMIQQEWYHPYHWQVRLFKEFVPQETHVFFTPAGKPLGFTQVLAEDDELPSLTNEQARALAEQTAQEIWQVDLAPYEFFESANERKPNGRVDHTFVYQRTDRDLKAGKYRLKIVVSGNQVTQLEPYIHVPQEFLLRYREMRSANNAIANAAGMFAYIFYILLGAIIALFLLIRSGFVIWRTPILWALIIAGLNFAAKLSEIPLNWTYYSTQYPMQGFLLNLLAQALYQTFITFIIITLVFAAAESLTRRALPHVAQLWRSWDKGIANSYTVGGYTLGGYLWTSIDLAYIVIFYYLTNTYLNWWSPISHLADPNILAEYIPWLSPVALSLQAAFLEECKFRAIPLASAILIGKRFGNQRLWLIAAFILQAIVFSGAHANYPSLPAYARLIELILPSFLFGGLYLRFGLMPTVISHYLYDLILFAMPIFISSSPFAWVNKLCVIICAFIPLGIVAYRYLQQANLIPLPSDAYNESWIPTKVQLQQKDSTPILTLTSPTKWRFFAYAAIAVAVGIWAFLTRFTQDAPALTISKSEAIDAAREKLAQRYPEFVEQLSTLYPTNQLFADYHGSERASGKLQHKYIWQTYGKDTYHKLLGSFLYPPMWFVRFLQFNGDNVARAHLFGALVGATSKDDASHHTVFDAFYLLPDLAPGAILSEKEARIIADRALVDAGVDLTTTQLVSAVAHKHPERQDWTFTYAHTQVLPQEQARTIVLVEGEKTHQILHEVHVPESWQREQTKHESTAQALMTFMHLLLRMLFIAGMIYALIEWAHHRISGKVFIVKFLIFTTMTLLSITNGFAAVIAQINTQEPFFNQIFMHINSSLLQLLLRCGIFAFVGAMLMAYRPASRYKEASTRIFIGVLVGSIILAVKALISYFSPNLEPTWATYSPLASWFTIPAFILSHTSEFLITAMTYALVYIIISYIVQNQPKSIFAHLLALCICILGGLMVYAMKPIDDISYWLIAGSVLGTTFYIVWLTVMRHAYSSIVYVVALQIISDIIQQMLYAPFNNIIVAGISTIIIIISIAFLWLKEYEQTLTTHTVPFDM